MLKRLFSQFIIFLIKLYRLCLSPFLVDSCRHDPTCSEYAIEAIKKHGIFRGFVLSVKRIWRCRPGGTSGYDPVPDK
ncbi:MAG: membrane protein insertion efficiency factor YidD [Candidatus Zapsychrus exili]|nr:membrane protein insertion efficiency factor YidD [Candidatus Zapsychrus exili]